MEKSLKETNNKAAAKTEEVAEINPHDYNINLLNITWREVKVVCGSVSDVAAQVQLSRIRKKKHKKASDQLTVWELAEVRNIPVEKVLLHFKKSNDEPNDIK